MTATAALNPELADTPCSVAECLETANVMGRATVSADPRTAMPPDFETVTLGLPLCVNHAHLLHHGCTLTAFDSGL